jgi:hypothetical protein
MAGRALQDHAPEGSDQFCVAGFVMRLASRGGPWNNVKLGAGPAPAGKTTRMFAGWK